MLKYIYLRVIILLLTLLKFIYLLFYCFIYFFSSIMLICKYFISQFTKFVELWKKKKNSIFIIKNDNSSFLLNSFSNDLKFIISSKFYFTYFYNKIHIFKNYFTWYVIIIIRTVIETMKEILPKTIQ